LYICNIKCGENFAITIFYVKINLKWEWEVVFNSNLLARREMKMEETATKKWKFLFWGFVSGMVVLSILGFTAFGWVTGGTAQERIDRAVLPLAAEICVQNFRADPNFEQNLVAFGKEEYWRRDRFLEEEGEWAIMPGDNAPMDGVANTCASKLSGLLKE